MSSISNRRLSTRELTMTALFVTLITAGAFIRVPLPNCPFTLQILFTTLAGIIIRQPPRFAISVGIYIILGLIRCTCVYIWRRARLCIATYIRLFDWIYGWRLCSGSL